MTVMVCSCRIGGTVLAYVALEHGPRPPGRGKQLCSVLSSGPNAVHNPPMAFVGRARALSRLLAAVEEASGGRARLVPVSGEVGIGA
ncbi:MAG: hypothetical protein ACRDUV_04325 [Pseudonocardiaceae bacterium]